MSLVTCKLCGRLFDSTRSRICVQCIDDLDDLYPKVREYIRDHQGESFSVDVIAEDMGVDILRVQALVEMGYLDREVPGISGIDEEKKRKEALVQQLKKSMTPPPPPKPVEKKDGKTQTMYGQERHGTSKKR